MKILFEWKWYQTRWYLEKIKISSSWYHLRIPICIYQKKNPVPEIFNCFIWIMEHMEFDSLYFCYTIVCILVKMKLLRVSCIFFYFFFFIWFYFSFSFFLYYFYFYICIFFFFYFTRLKVRKTDSKINRIIMF